MIEVNLPTMCVIALVAAVGAYFGSYLREKGKNLATHEDIDRVVRKTEDIRAEIAGGLWVEQSRWQFRADTYRALLESLGDASSALRQLMFVDEWRPRLNGIPEAGERLDAMEKEYGVKAGAAFERFIRTTSVAGMWLDRSAMKALEDYKAAYLDAQGTQENPPSAAVFSARCIEAAKSAMEALTNAAREDLQLMRNSR